MVASGEQWCGCCDSECHTCHSDDLWVSPQQLICAANAETRRPESRGYCLVDLKSALLTLVSKVAAAAVDRCVVEIACNSLSVSVSSYLLVAVLLLSGQYRSWYHRQAC